MKYVGVDIGGTNLKAGLTDENGQLLAVQKMKVPPLPTSSRWHGRSCR